jgi:hypothetical protein
MPSPNRRIQSDSSPCRWPPPPSGCTECWFCRPDRRLGAHQAHPPPQQIPRRTHGPVADMPGGQDVQFGAPAARPPGGRAASAPPLMLISPGTVQRTPLLVSAKSASGELQIRSIPRPYRKGLWPLRLSHEFASKLVPRQPGRKIIRLNGSYDH